MVGRETEHPDAHETWVTVTRLQLPLCGGSRPHFFRGVATVGSGCCCVMCVVCSQGAVVR